MSGNRTQATLVGDKCSPHFAILLHLSSMLSQAQSILKVPASKLIIVIGSCILPGPSYKDQQQSTICNNSSVFEYHTTDSGAEQLAFTG